MTLPLLFSKGLVSVSTTLTPTYDVRQLGTKTLGPIYDVTQLATKTLSPAFDVRQLANKTTDILTPIAFSVADDNANGIVDGLSDGAYNPGGLTVEIAVANGEQHIHYENTGETFNQYLLTRTITGASSGEQYTWGFDYRGNYEGGPRVAYLVWSDNDPTWAKAIQTMDFPTTSSKRMEFTYTVPGINDTNVSVVFYTGMRGTATTGDSLETWLSNFTITKKEPIRYHISQLATDTLSPTYDVRQLGTKTLAPSYDVTQRVTKTLTPTYDIQATGLTPVSKTLTPTYDVRELVSKTVVPTFRIWNHITTISGVEMTSNETYIWGSVNQAKTWHFHTDTPCPPEGNIRVWFQEPIDNLWFHGETINAQDTTSWTVQSTANIVGMQHPERAHTLWIYYDKESGTNDWGAWASCPTPVYFNYITQTNDVNEVYHRHTDDAVHWTLGHPLTNLNGSFQVFFVDAEVASPYYGTWYDVGGLNAPTQGQTSFSKSDLAWDASPTRLINEAHVHVYYRPDKDVWGGWWDGYGGNPADFTTLTARVYDYNSKTVTLTYDINGLANKTLSPTFDSRQLATRVLGSERHNMLMNSYLVDQAPTDTYPDGWYHGGWSNNNPFTLSVVAGKDGRNAFRCQYTPHASDTSVGFTLQQAISSKNKQFHGGEQAAVSVWIKGSVPRFLSQFRWENADGQPTYSWAGLSLDPTTYGDWTNVGWYHTVPAGCDRLTAIDYYWESVSSSSPAVDIYITQPLIERGSVLMDYFDGESPNSSWDGSQYYTQSTEIVPVSYDIHGLANKTLQPSYDMRQLATKQVTPTYNMRSLSNKTITPTYNMRSLSNQTVTPTYNIREKQNQTLSPSYNINCLRGQTLSPTYNMRSLANQVLSPAYDINIKVNKTLTPMYDIKAQKAIRGLRRVYGTMYIAYKESPRATTSVVDEAAISSPRVQQGGAKVCQ